jgi:class 3 adenylate cyclase
MNFDSDNLKLPQNLGIVIVDSNSYTRSLLVEHIARIPDCFLLAYDKICMLNVEKLPTSCGLLILNHHAQDVSPLAFLASVKLLNPKLHTLIIVSPGAEKRKLEHLRNAGQIDVFFEKPIDPEALAKHIEQEVIRQNKALHLATEHLNLLRFMPTGALRRLFKQPEPGHAELFDMCVMFTDIRDSSRHIAQSSAQDYFARLNRILGEQARLIRIYDGMVVKTTGDGLLAVFEGAARAHLALKCAHAIQGSPNKDGVEVGIGISDGLVLTGLLGTHEHMHFDVIGAHVHVSSRLCSLAQGGEILATQDVAHKARFEFFATPLTEVISVRGFATPIACAHIQPQLKELS